jgi:hypothetical protein
MPNQKKAMANQKKGVPNQTRDANAAAFLRQTRL